MSAVTKSARVACTMWIPIVVLALTVMATTYPVAAKTGGPAVVQRIVTARLTDVPSHNRLYRASLYLTSDSIWTLRLRSASGAPIRNGSVAVEAWMPEQERVAPVAPTATEYAGAGTYRVRPVALDRPGWWNISVQVAAAGRTDSLAFNVIVR